MTPETPITVVLASSFRAVDHWRRQRDLRRARVVAITAPEHVYRVLSLRGYNIVDLGSPWATPHDLNLIGFRATLTADHEAENSPHGLS